MFRKLLLCNRQGYTESLEEYDREIFEITRNKLLFENIKAVFAATSLRRYEKYIHGENDMNEESFMFFIKRADIRVK